MPNILPLLAFLDGSQRIVSALESVNKEDSKKRRTRLSQTKQ
jgi:hypothetical protein